MNEDYFNQMIKPFSSFVKQISVKTDQQIAQILQKFYELYNPIIEDLAKLANEWQKQQKQNLNNMAKYGWFPNWYTFRYKPLVKINDIDTLMTMHLNDCWPRLTNKIVEFCTKKEII